MRSVIRPEAAGANVDQPASITTTAKAFSAIAASALAARLSAQWMRGSTSSVTRLDADVTRAMGAAGTTNARGMRYVYSTTATTQCRLALRAKKPRTKSAVGVAAFAATESPTRVQEQHPTEAPAPTPVPSTLGRMEEPPPAAADAQRVQPAPRACGFWWSLAGRSVGGASRSLLRPGAPVDARVHWPSSSGGEVELKLSQRRWWWSCLRDSSKDCLNFVRLGGDGGDAAWRPGTWDTEGRVLSSGSRRTECVPSFHALLNRIRTRPSGCSSRRSRKSGGRAMYRHKRSSRKRSLRAAKAFGPTADLSARSARWGCLRGRKTAFEACLFRKSNPMHCRTSGLSSTPLPSTTPTVNLVVLAKNAREKRACGNLHGLNAIWQRDGEGRG
ncbi:MAG: hypothetical protein ACI9KE_004302 [Polyangiales bacterium]|jgi:hypothetical protein